MGCDNRVLCEISTWSDGDIFICISIQILCCFTIFQLHLTYITPDKSGRDLINKITKIISERNVWFLFFIFEGGGGDWVFVLFESTMPVVNLAAWFWTFRTRSITLKVIIKWVITMNKHANMSVSHKFNETTLKCISIFLHKRQHFFRKLSLFHKCLIV